MATECVGRTDDDVSVMIYSSKQVDEIRSALSSDIADLNKRSDDLIEEQKKLRRDVESTISNTLKSLPPQLFSLEIQNRLKDELVGELVARLDDMKTEIREEVKAELLSELSTLISRSSSETNSQP